MNKVFVWVLLLALLSMSSLKVWGHAIHMNDYDEDMSNTVRYVNAQNGQDQGSCTTASAPCQTLEYATSICNPNDVLYIEGSFAPAKTIYVLNGKPLSFIANSTTTTVDCGPSKLSSAFILQDSTLLSGFTIKNCGTANLTSTSTIPTTDVALNNPPPDWNEFAAVVVTLGNTNQRTANFSDMVIQSNSKAVMCYSSRMFITKSTFLFNGGSYSNQVMTAAIGTSGSAIYATGSSIIASQTLFANNVAQALVGKGGEPTVGGQGGAIYAYDTQLNFTGVAFTSNQVINGSGGSLYLDQSEIQMFKTLMSGNSAADGSGGSIYASGSTIWSINATLDQNYVTQSGYVTLSEIDGGSIYAFDCTVQLRNTTLTSNSINGVTAYGGGLSLKECSTMLWGINAQNNSVTSQTGGGGGAIYANFGTNILWNSSLDHNEALGSALGGAILLDTSTFVIYNSTMGFDLCGTPPSISNTTLACGGAAALIDSTFVATSVNFFNNTQSDIYCLRSSAELYDINDSFVPTVDCGAQCDASLNQEVLCVQ
eukprot:TRINITY_DN7693_c0_g1_i1.p1 TRINITY_DN7693_c0_g1~~TRINITY_DN7693_c0_g1_i1.p1  ORF type:complete len:539 (-),score=133.12 TRINITY_DN7693_c0_g1_i1:22-1638(-)